ncbi:thermonuclease family protein, partial [Escherichia coli]|nr:thermonuclease family protein [Escherichia coli]
GTLYANGRSVQAQLVAQGLALYYTTYSKHCPDRLEIAAAENYARESKLGLWNLAQFTPPWQYRAQKKPATEIAP